MSYERIFVKYLTRLYATFLLTLFFRKVTVKNVVQGDQKCRKSMANNAEVVLFYTPKIGVAK